MSVIRMVFCNIIVLVSCICFTPVGSKNTNEDPYHTIVTVTRGIHNAVDVFTVCSRDHEPLVRFFDDHEDAETMNCSAVTSDKMKCETQPALEKRYDCQCQAITQNYVESLKKCASNSELRQGCVFRFGSWQYERGWAWNTKDAPLLPVFFDAGFAMTGSFNVKKKDYKTCILTNITMLNQDGEWYLFEHNPFNVKIYTYKEFYQINWLRNDVDADTKAKLQGKLLRIYITCDPVNYGLDIGIKEPLTSCFALKVTGTTTAEHKKMGQPEERSSSNATAITVGVVFAVLFVIIGVVLAVFLFYRRRAGGKDFLPKPCWRI